MTLQQAINTQLKARKKTVAQMVKYVGMSTVNYSKMIKENRLAFEYVEKIAQFLDMPLPELLLPVYYNKNEAAIIGGIIGEVRSKINAIG
ncbi:MAG: helix-turn-helix domain-containing protein [Mangrovibacterium sp.]